MGRLRAVTRSNEDDPGHRASKRKKTSHGIDNLQIASAVTELTEGKRALYHCNYCNKDISSMVRIKCAVCPDFDLCVECYSVGAEVTPHKCNHPYKVMDNLSFPLFCPDWNADEEILLLEGIEMYGFGNWAEVGEHVGTKSKPKCIDHFNAIYMNSPCFPLPDMSHVMGKTREELVAMAKEHCEVKKEVSTASEMNIKEDAFHAIVKFEAPMKEDSAHQFSSNSTGGFKHHKASTNNNALSATHKKACNGTQTRDSTKVEEVVSDRSIRVPVDEGPSVTELSGYNLKRQEFEVEYDNDAEQILADMEFKDSDTVSERELKLKVLRIYNKRLDERKHRKDFVIERNLLYADPFEKNLSPDEREIYQRFKVFSRFHSQEEHEELLKSVIEEHRIIKRIQELQEARVAGCYTGAQANSFIQEKRKKEAEKSAQRLQAGTGGKVLLKLVHQDSSPRGVLRAFPGLQPGGKDSSSDVPEQVMPSTFDDWDITGFPGSDLLSETEKLLCNEIRILPAHYLKMLETLSTELMKGNISKKSDARGLFKVDPNKVDRIYDLMVKKGIASA